MERLTSAISNRRGVGVHLLALAILLLGVTNVARLMSGVGSIVTWPINREFHFAGNGYEIFNTQLLMVYLIAAFGLSHILGSGLISLGHSAFFGVGAYTVSIGTLVHGLNFYVALALAGLVSAVAGFLLGLPALRLSHFTLAMITLAYGLVLNDLIERYRSVTHGGDGMPGVQRPSGLTSDGRYYWLLAGALVLSYAVMHNLLRSPVGRRAKAVAESENAAQSIGINLRATKLASFTVGSVFAGVAGGLYAGLVGYVAPSAFIGDLAILFLLMVLFGGSGSLAGPIVGAILLFRIPLEVERVSPKPGAWTLMIYGAILLASVYFFPRGIMSVYWRLRARYFPVKVAGKVAAIEPGTTGLSERSLASVIETPTAPEQLLVAVDVAKTLGGVQALKGLDLTLRAAQIHGLIGPNGSGKTTFLNTLCGYVAPDRGSVTLSGEAIDGVKPFRRARAGLARTFQTPLLFEHMSCLENVLVAVDLHHHRSALGYLLRLPSARHAERTSVDRATAILDAVGLGRRRDDAAADLPPGERRLLELGRAIALRPTMIVMDEPAAGLTDTEVEHLGRFIVELKQNGIAVILVEHHVDLVRKISDVVTVIDAGARIALGTPHEVMTDPVVIKTYLGEMSFDDELDVPVSAGVTSGLSA
jgi:branched-chain amino acid transport system permease protein